jgi:hypothetical protein
MVRIRLYAERSTREWESREKGRTKHVLSHGPDLEADTSDGGKALGGLEVLEIGRVGDSLGSPDALVGGVVDERGGPLASVRGVGDKGSEKQEEREGRGKGGWGKWRGRGRGGVSERMSLRSKGSTRLDRTVQWKKHVLRPRTAARSLLAERVRNRRSDPVSILLVVPLLRLLGIGVGDHLGLVGEPTFRDGGLLVDNHGRSILVPVSRLAVAVEKRTKKKETKATSER